MENDVGIVEEFMAVFNPQKGKYTIKSALGTIVMRESPLPKDKLREYLEGKEWPVYGFFVGGVQRPYFGIDIDDHVGGGWLHNLNGKQHLRSDQIENFKNWSPASGEGFEIWDFKGFTSQRSEFEQQVVGLEEGPEQDRISMEHIKDEISEPCIPTETLTALYQEVIRRIGHEPSAVFRSPRGLHLYWLFEKPISNKNLEAVIGKKVTNDKLAEFLPTRSHSLRVPRPKAYLGGDLQPKEFSGFGSLKRYPNEELFGGTFKPKALRSIGRSKVKKEPGTRKRTKAEVGFGLEQVKAIEERVGPFRNGESNDQYLPIVNAHIKAGLNEEQSMTRFNDLLDRSLGYSGPLRSEISAKVASSYRNLGSEGRKPLVEHEEIGPEVEAFISWTMKETGVDLRAHARVPFRRFILELLAWKRKFDQMKDNKEELAAHNEKHPGSWTRLMRGYYPLPSEAMRAWNDNYDWIIDALSRIGVLVEMPGGYHVDSGRCKHYRINVNLPFKKEDTGAE